MRGRCDNLCCRRPSARRATDREDCVRLDVSAFATQDNWVGVCILAGVLAFTCGFLIVRFA